MEALLSTPTSEAAYARRRAVLPSGVTGAGRIDEPYPLVFERGAGQFLYDIDGNQYLDHHGGYGSAVLGYAHPRVDGAVQEALREGHAFVGVAHRHEAELAERLCGLLPEAERVALCGGGGTDALYHAVRLARAATGRSKVLKLEGGYQGWHGDLGASTSPALDDPAPLGMPAAVPNSAGVLTAVTDAVLVNAANDTGALRERFARDGPEIAALVVEPVLYSCGCVPVDAGFLELARELCTRHGAVLVFDEVLSGFRVVVGGAGSLGIGVIPDLACYGKALANGHVLSALVGRADLMDELAPGGPVFYSGTFNGHPLGVAAAQATLDELTETDALARAGALAARIAAAIEAQAAELGIPARCPAIGAVFNLYLGAVEPVRDYRALLRSLGGELEGTNRLLRHHLRERGIFMQRRAGTNRCFVSAAHGNADGDRTVAAIGEFLATHQAELAA